MSRLRRPASGLPWARAVEAAPNVLTALMAGAFVTAGALIAGAEGLVLGLLAFGIVLLPLFYMEERWERMVRRAAPTIEFLPDDGTSQWVELLKRIERIRNRLVGSVLFLAALVGILSAFHVI